MQNPFKILTDFTAARNMGNPVSMGSFIPPPNQQQNDAYEFYKPSYTMQNRFASLLDQMPQPEKVGLWRKLGASLGAMTSQNPAQTAMLTANAPYFNNLDNWLNRMKFEQQASDNERQMNQVGMNANNQIRNYQINQQKADEVERNNRAKNDVAMADSETKRIRALAYDFRTRNPNMVITAVPGGFLMGTNPQTGETAALTDENGAPIPSGKMSEQSRMELDQINKMNLANVNNAAAMQRVNTQQAGANSRNTESIAAAEKRNQDTIAGQNSRAANRGTGGTGSPLVNKKSRAIDVANRNPEWAPFINPDGTVKPAKEASSGLFGSSRGFSKEDRDKVVDYIEGKTNVIPIRGEGTVTPIKNTPGMPNIPAGAKVEARTSGTVPSQSGGKVLMMSPDGKTRGYVPESQVAAATAQGYKRVQ